MDFFGYFISFIYFNFFLNFWYEPLFLAQMAKKPQPNPYAWARSKPEERAVSSINLKKRDHHYFRQLKQFWVRNNTLNCMGRRRWIKKILKMHNINFKNVDDPKGGRANGVDTGLLRGLSSRSVSREIRCPPYAGFFLTN